MYNGEILADFILAVVGANCQTAKFNSSPNFPAIIAGKFGEELNLYYGTSDAAL